MGSNTQNTCLIGCTSCVSREQREINRLKMLHMKKVKINGEYEIILPEHRANRPEWFSEMGWEKKRLQSMKEHLNDKDIMFYVGNEEGDMSALLAMWGVKLGLFEPNPKVWPNTKVIWEANKLPMPLFSFCGFASSQTTEGGMYVGFPPSASGDVIGDHGFMELQNHNAPEIKIDDIGIEPTAISIDVEGSEWEVLKGAKNTLRDHRPKIWLSIHPEFAFRIYGTYSNDLRKWIKDFGYTETILDYQHELHLFYQ